MACCRLGKEDGDKLRQNILVHNFIALHLKVPAANVSATKHKKNESWGEKVRTKTRGAGERKGGERKRGRESCRQGLEAAIPESCNYPDDIIGQQRRLIIITPQDTFSL